MCHNMSPRENDGEVGRDRRARRCQRMNSARPAVAPYLIAKNLGRAPCRLHGNGAELLNFEL